MNVLDVVKSVLPWIGTALGGPLGGVAADAIGKTLGISNTAVEDVKSILAGMSPEKLAELKQADQEFQLKMAELGYDQLYRLEKLNNESAISNAADINKTMQAEATAEHWPTYSWRPAIGFAVAFNLTSASLVVFIAYIFKPDLVAAIPNMLTAQAGLNAVAMPILGIASWFRGKAQSNVSDSIPSTVQSTSTVITSKG